MNEFTQLNVRINYHGVRDLGNGHSKEEVSYYMTFEGRPETPTHWYFCMDRPDFETIARKGHGMVSDGYHKLEAGFGRWLFFDLEVPHRAFGEVITRYYSMQMPSYAAKVLARYLRMQTRGMQKDESKTLEIPLASRERLLLRYGQGTGQVTLTCDERSQEALERAKKDPVFGEDFKEQLERLTTIARNSTYRWNETASLTLWGHGDYEFGWAAKTPAGRTTMSGGLILHGRHDKGGDGSAPTFAVNLSPVNGWSIHT